LRVLASDTNKMNITRHLSNPLVTNPNTVDNLKNDSVLYNPPTCYFKMFSFILS
jgi:hypothetical protein